ncbi:FeS-binding protein [candidate division LCP-89 bacterium B3_LCP]|uniref:FeS-binding protein n=1 Tax=candidate division LCP-89 bacterium B3_LCP TaxID=2012998 RepID=A0A532UYX0_UNCL8|nr:MAG: FeS-binding protein [candidate division LCP-89 bacterium B3_LCP]
MKENTRKKEDVALPPGLERASSFRIQPYRKIIQYGFLVITLLIGYRFTLFVGQLESSGPVITSRPPGVEAFLPISSLISLKYWLLTGIFNKIHPAGLVLFLIILGTGILLKKGFCSWVCPIGLLSEILAKIPKTFFGRGLNLPKWLDYPLRSIKYFLLIFFLWAILAQMDLPSLEKFVYSPYNKVADIKMLKFFTEISAFALWVLVGLVFFSVGIPYFWCRYLCPYGALLGSISWLSIMKVKRNEPTCIDCQRCTDACPARIKVHDSSTIHSDECHCCMKCVDACPVKDTLSLPIVGVKKKMSRMVYAVLIVLLFLLGTSIARWTGFWQNEISIEEYNLHIEHLDEPWFDHNRGEVEDISEGVKLREDQ